MIAFLGMGHLGANFVRALLKRGGQVQVWNRTPDKAKALEAYGAKSFDRVEDAVKGAKKIHLTLKDDDSVNEILEQASGSFGPGAMIIDHTTTSAKGAAERTELWKSRGYTYLHAPVFMGPQNALESTGFMLVSGDKAVIGPVEEELGKMTGKLLYFGPENNKAAGMKLLGNLFLIAMTGGIVDMLTLAKASDITSEEVSRLLESWNPAGMIPARLKKMTEGVFDQPTWELDMARKDAGLMMSGAQAGERKLTVIPAIAASMDEWIAKGHGHDDWTVIGKDAVTR
jgi:3-hydroxyisobutyrate dehydrogenase